ncbi:MAG: RNase J family beta-CASP ribonuclease [Clostridiales bacterium]
MIKAVNSHDDLGQGQDLSVESPVAENPDPSQIKTIDSPPIANSDKTGIGEKNQNSGVKNSPVRSNNANRNNVSRNNNLNKNTANKTTVKKNDDGKTNMNNKNLPSKKNIVNNNENKKNTDLNSPINVANTEKTAAKTTKPLANKPLAKKPAARNMPAKATATSMPKSKITIQSVKPNVKAPLNKNHQSIVVAKAVDSKESKLKVIPLGGLGEVGKNMTAFQYGNNIIVIDGGVIFPEEELLGIDMVIPDYSFLMDNKDIVRGFLLTHGHEDHIGGMPYILKELQVPVYGSRLTLGLLKGKLQEHRVVAKLHEIVPRKCFDIGPFHIEPIRVSHSIPDSLAFAIHTPVGTIMVVYDFKLDMSPIDGQLMDFGSLSRIGEQGVLLMLADSTNVEKEGFTPSERTVGVAFDRILLSAQGRVIITSFASNVHRVQQAIWAAEKCHRKVAIVGRGMQNVSTIAKDLGYLEIPKGLVIDIDQVNSLPANQVLILTTGSQGEPLSGLTRMSMGEHKQVQILPGDLVIISATPIPGNERLVGRTIDNLYRQGAQVIYQKSEGIHVSGHASREELKVLMNIIKPKYFMPVHGEYRMLYKHALLAQELGMAEENIFVMENGQVLEIGRRRARINGSVNAGRILIDGLGIGDVGNTILKERKLLSQGGIVVINLVVEKATGKIISGPEILSRGFIFEKEYEHIIGEAKEKVVGICAKQMRNSLSHFFFDRIGRRPIVLPFITEV